ncbi:hypothetical protein [Rubritalea tangerina]|uniref:hypothetical protein n=1 Tax=Rubritalea tangerina TaxID=430798 RepID=UPI00361953AF
MNTNTRIHSVIEDNCAVAMTIASMLTFGVDLISCTLKPIMSQGRYSVSGWEDNGKHKSLA